MDARELLIPALHFANLEVRLRGIFSSTIGRHNFCFSTDANKDYLVAAKKPSVLAEFNQLEMAHTTLIR